MAGTQWGDIANNPDIMSSFMNQYMNPSIRPYLPSLMPPQMFGMQAPYQMPGMQGTQNTFWR
jgi:hypothetical protein